MMLVKMKTTLNKLLGSENRVTVSLQGDSNDINNTAKMFGMIMATLNWIQSMDAIIM